MGGMAVAQTEFTDAQGIVYSIADGKAIVKDGQKASGEVVIPAKIENVDVVEVAQGAFLLNDNISALTLPDNITIGKVAFQLCGSLTRITVGNVSSIGTYAFLGTNVNTLIFSEGVTAISDIATNFASTLESVEIPNNAMIIGDNAFNGCSKLKTLNLKNVIKIGNSAFSASGLTSIDLSNVDIIGNNAFESCLSLESVDLDDVSSVGSSAFRNCGNIRTGKGLKSLTWSSNCKAIPESAFEGCAVLKDVEGIDAVTSIEAYAFYNCSSLSSLPTLSKRFQSVYAYAFFGTGLSEMKFQSNPILSSNSLPSGCQKHLLLSDGERINLVSGASNTFNKVIYTRNNLGTYGAMYLPFTPKSDNNHRFYTFGNVEGSVISFERAETPAANVPYLYQGSNEIESDGAVTVTDQFYAQNLNSTSCGNWEAVGSYGDESSTDGYYHVTSDGSYYGISGGAFVRYVKDTDIKVKPYRVYWHQSAAQGASFMLRLPDGSTTNIELNENDGVDAIAKYYDLMGRRVLEPTKGNIYIVNGNKIVY